MKIGVCCTFYNGLEGLKRLIPSILQFDYIILNDGAWKDFQSGGLSTDGSREYIKQFPQIFLLDNPDLMPNEKQTIHLKEAARLGCDCVILIDDDEYVTDFDRAKFEKNLSQLRRSEQAVYWCDFYEKHDKNYVLFQYPRIVVEPEKCEYKDRHNQIWAYGKEQIHKKKGLIIQGITLRHDKLTRTDEREAYNKNWNLTHPRH